MNINMQQDPGNYTLSFEVLGSVEEIKADMAVQVVGCGPGQINVTGELGSSGQVRLGRSETRWL